MLSLIISACELFFAFAQRETQRSKFELHFLERFSAEVAHLHHFLLVAFNELRNGVDAGTFESVIRTNREIEFFDRHIVYLFFAVRLFIADNFNVLHTFGKVREQ